MSIRTALNSGINNGQRDMPIVSVPVTQPITSSYTRPADWPALPSMTSSDSKFLGLLAVTNDNSNYIAMTVTLGSANSISSSFIGDGASPLGTGNVFVMVGTPGQSLAGVAINQFITGGTVSANTYITNVETASFTVSSGTTTPMVVTSVSSGTLKVGMAVTYGASLSSTRYIIAQTSGTTGGVGTYTLSGGGMPGTPVGGTYVTVNNSQLVSTAFTAVVSNSYTVDWGDGVGPIMYQSGTVAQNQYNYSTLGTSVTSRGYKTASVTMVPLVGSLTNINLQTKYVPVANTGTLNQYIGKWLDISLGSPTLTAVTIGSTLTTPFHMLEQVSFYGVATTFTTAGSTLFSNLSSLQSVPVLNLSPAYTTLASIFLSCRSLNNIPTLPSTSAASVDCSAMFQNCFSLQIVPDSVVANIANKVGSTTSMFQTCYALKSVPMLTWAAGSFTANSMFQNCYVLPNVPQYNLRYITNISNMFDACYALLNVPPLICPLVTTATQAFNNCFSLQTVPAINLPQCTSAVAMFGLCRSLKTIPAMNFPSLTNFNAFFSGCTNLISVGVITSNVTDTTNMFQNCSSLIEGPTFSNTANLAIMGSMFNSCTSLKSVPNYNTANVTTMSATFLNCSSLATVPTFNTTKVTRMDQTFQACFALISIPAFDTSNVTRMDSMASSCSSLNNIGFTNTTKVTTFNSAFNGCAILKTEVLTQGAPNSWNTSNVTDMVTMFQSCSLITTIPTFDTTKVTNMQTMLAGCTSLIKVPALNVSNVVSGMTTMFNSTSSLSDVLMTGTKVSLTLGAAQLSKTALENIFANSIVPNATSQTISIASNPGTDTAVTRTGTTTANSNVITMANTVSLTANMILTSGNGFGIANNAATLYQANSQIVLTTGQAPANGMPISIATAPSGVTGYTQYQPYYVANSGVAAANAFQISTSNGGGALSFTGTGSLAGQIRFATYINSVVANTSITVSNPATAAFTGINYVFRTLDVSQAVLKNWTVSG